MQLIQKHENEQIYGQRPGAHTIKSTTSLGSNANDIAGARAKPRGSQRFGGQVSIIGYVFFTTAKLAVYLPMMEAADVVAEC